LRRFAAGTVLTAIFLTAAAGLATPAAAQLSVDSLIRTLHPADSTTSLEIAVRNDADHAVDVRVEFADWEITDDGSHRFHPVGTLAGSCGGAIAVEPADSAAPGLRLAAGGGASVRVSHSGSAGDICRVMIWFRTDDVPLGDDEGVTFIMRTGVKLYVEPRGSGSR
jgi:P pilus assembly chaperone PapD